MWIKSCVIKNNTLGTINHKAVIRVCRLHQYEMSACKISALADGGFSILQHINVDGTHRSQPLDLSISKILF